MAHGRIDRHAEDRLMRTFCIRGFALLGWLIGGLSMAALILYAAPPPRVSVLGYLVEIFGASAVGAALFSIMAWLFNQAARARS